MVLIVKGLKKSHNHVTQPAEQYITVAGEAPRIEDMAALDRMSAELRAKQALEAQQKQLELLSTKMESLRAKAEATLVSPDERAVRSKIRLLVKNAARQKKTHREIADLLDKGNRDLMTDDRVRGWIRRYRIQSFADMLQSREQTRLWKKFISDLKK